MCKITNKTDLNKVIGYKAVIKKGGKYYSPSTGLEYKKGMKLPNMKTRRINADTRDWSNPLYSESKWYNKAMQGKTGVFKRKNDCIVAMEHNKQYHILEMTLTGNIHHGTFDADDDIYLGEVIEDFELVGTTRDYVIR